MDALVAAAQVVPRQPGGDPSSAHSILSRWRQRTGVAVDSNDVLGSGAWEVGAVSNTFHAMLLARRCLVCRTRSIYTARQFFLLFMLALGALL